MKRRHREREIGESRDEQIKKWREIDKEIWRKKGDSR